MAISLVQTATNNSSGANSTIVATFGSNITAGNMVVVFTACTTTTISSVTDGPGDSFTAVRSSPLLVDSSAATFGMWFALNSAGGSKTVTVNTNGANGGQTIIAQEWSGVATSGALDTSNDGLDSSGTSVSTSNITTTNANDLLLACWGVNGNSTSFTATGSWSNAKFAGNASSQVSVVTDSQIVSATGTYSGTGTISAGFSWRGMIAAFQAAAATTTSTSSTSSSTSISSTSSSTSTSISSTSSSTSISTSSTSSSVSTSTSSSISTSSTSSSTSTSISTSTSSTSSSQSTSTSISSTSSSISTSSSTSSTSVSTSSSTSISISSTSQSTSSTTTLALDVTKPTMKQIAHTQNIIALGGPSAVMDDPTAIMDDPSVEMGGPTSSEPTIIFKTGDL